MIEEREYCNPVKVSAICDCGNKLKYSREHTGKHIYLCEKCGKETESGRKYPYIDYGIIRYEAPIPDNTFKEEDAVSDDEFKETAKETTNIESNTESEGESKISLKEQLKLVNSYFRKNITADDVYIFKIKLCDNSIDGKFDRISKNALFSLQKMFVGKTGVMMCRLTDTGRKLPARIFYTWVETDLKRSDKMNEPLSILYAYAFIIRNNDNNEIINLIADRGDFYDAEISYSASSHVCNLCGQNQRISLCRHIKGESYYGKQCYTIINDVVDVYDWACLVKLRKTYKEDFLEKFPDAELDVNGNPRVRVCRVYSTVKCDKDTCVSCWNEVMKHERCKM